MIRNTIEKIRRKENRIYALLHDSYKKLHNFDFSLPKPLLALLFAERAFRWEIWYWMKNKLYYEQLLRYACAQVGKNIKLDGDMPLIAGNGFILLGDNVTIGNRCAFIVIPNLFDKPKLIIGSNTNINYQTEISVEYRVEIGNHCQIAGQTKIFDNNSHSIHYGNDRKMTKDDVAPVKIEDHVWVGMRSIILKGVTIGKGSVVAAGAIVTTDVPPMTVVAGNPAKVIKEIPEIIK